MFAENIIIIFLIIIIAADKCDELLRGDDSNVMNC